MRLVCPRCGAQYEIDDAAIPPAGRDVECSACDHVWRAGRPAVPLDPAPFDPAARPPLSRPLSDEVIAILREEASLELESRAAGRQAERAARCVAQALTGTAPVETETPDDTSVHDPRDGGPAAPAPGLEPGASGSAVADSGRGVEGAGAPAIAAADDNPDAGDAIRSAQGPEPGAAPAPEPAPAPSTPADPYEPERTITASPQARALMADADPQAQRSDRAPPSHRRARAAARRRHDAGFHVAVMAALVALALYAAAPGMADQGPVGAALMDWRTRVDHGRDWLDERGNALIARLAGR